jgi:energy-coupling factor transporter ATP-binding protein EcfA2
MKVLIVYVGQGSTENYEHGIQHGVWGFKPNKRPNVDFGPGDYILFGRDFKGGSPRLPASEWTQHSVGEIAWAKITSKLERQNGLEWPDEKRAGQVIYPFRLTFGEPQRLKRDIQLSGKDQLTPELAEALRLSAIANSGYVRELEKWPFDSLQPPSAPPKLEEQQPSTDAIQSPPQAAAGDVLIEVESFMAARGFAFSTRVLRAFYASLRSKPFVILAGNSGTGKSRLVRLFSEASGATVVNGQFTMIPVRPDWNDSSELLGFFDLSGAFIPGQLITPILLAHRNPEKPFFVCLDEMNLARVEHYFSDFLSIIESRRKDGSAVTTDPILKESHLRKMKEDGLSSAVLEALNHLKARGQALGLPANLYVIGTVNMDETTQPFSRKVLDRANTIEFNDIDLLQGLDEDVAASEVPPLDLGQAFFRPEFTTLNDLLPAHRGKAKVIAQTISDLNQDLGLAGFEVGYRVRDEATSFAVYASDAGLSDEEVNEAIVLQKILPRVQGSSPRVEKLLMSLLKRLKGDSDVPDENDPELSHKLAALRVDDEASAIVRKIAGMLILFREENFTSFWLA